MFPPMGSVGADVVSRIAILAQPLLTALNLATVSGSTRRRCRSVNIIPVEAWHGKDCRRSIRPTQHCKRLLGNWTLAAHCSPPATDRPLFYVKTLSNVTDDRTLHNLVEGEKRRFQGLELFARTLGVLGLGAIGSQVARAALDLGMRVVGYDPNLSVDAAWRLPSEIQRMQDSRSLFSQSDYVTVHVPSLPTTRGLIDADALRAFRPGSVLLNFARQEIVDEGAIAAALTDGTLSAYFSDFPSTTLAKHHNAHSTPHLGASTVEAEENCAVMAAEQIRDFLSAGNIRNSVNFPDINLELSFGYRLAVANRNVAGSLGQVLSVLADDNVNVIDMINKSRADVAYNLIDIEQPPTPTMIERINAIDSVINLRLFDAPG